MTTKLDFDFKEFKKQQEALKKYAATEVANKIEQIKTLLQEVKELVEVAGIDVQLGGGYGSLTSAITAVDESCPNWNSSSYEC